jgi:addiction module RelE/StbE family toxin
MSKRTIRWSKRALRRLEQIGTVIANDNPLAAARVVARLSLAVAALSEHPAIGRVGRIAGTRELVFADIPYLIPYRVSANDILILTILHGAQKRPDEI